MTLYLSISDILITFENEVKIMRNCLIINVMFIQNDTLWVYTSEVYEVNRKNGVYIPVANEFRDIH